MRLLSFARKFGALDTRDQWALVPATVSLLVARVALQVLPFRTFLRWADPHGPRSGAPSSLDLPTRRRIRAVERAGCRLFPKNPCLIQAAVVQRLLWRKGHPSELRIGVRKEGGKHLEAHAWVESGGEVVVGARGRSDEHVPLPLSGRVEGGGHPSRRE